MYAELTDRTKISEATPEFCKEGSPPYKMHKEETFSKNMKKYGSSYRLQWNSDVKRAKEFLMQL